MLSLCFYKCSSIKNIAPSQSLLYQESFLKNGEPIKRNIAKQLSISSPNSKILGIPAKLHLYNLAKDNPDSLFDHWLNKKNKRSERLTKVYSKKQKVIAKLNKPTNKLDRGDFKKLAMLKKKKKKTKSKMA